MSARLSRPAQRWNALLSVVLLALGVVLVNGLARDHLRVKHDLSEDQLFAPSPELTRRLAGLDDLLVVTAYFTGAPEHGRDKIARSRLMALLEDWQEEAGGRMRLEVVDPSASSAAKLEALRLGIRPYASEGSRTAGSYSAQEVWWGLSLSYRGRERAIPIVLPQTLEYAFASELFRLTADRVPRIGLVTPAPGDGGDDWQRLAAALARSGEVVPIEHLAVADAVPVDLDLLVVARPMGLHPRAAFAIDQHLQGGGRLLLAFDNHHYPSPQEPVQSTATGLEGLLATWGVVPTPGIVWDKECVGVLARRTFGGEEVDPVPVFYPHWLEVGPDGLADELPVTARLGGTRLFWAQGLGLPVRDGSDGPVDEDADEPVVEDTLTRTVMVRSSPRSWVVTPPSGVVIDPDLVDTQAAELAATRDGAPVPLAVALEGRFPTPFADGAPTPATLFDAVLGNGAWDGTTTDESVLDRAADGLAVVVGDSDWLSDEYLTPERGGLAGDFLANVVDWLLLEEDLLALRSRVPRPRPLVDFLAEERAARGVTDLNQVAGLDEPETRSAAEDAARAAADARRNGAMVRAAGGALLLGLLLVGLPGLLRARRRSAFADGGAR